MDGIQFHDVKAMNLRFLPCCKRKCRSSARKKAFRWIRCAHAWCEGSANGIEINTHELCAICLPFIPIGASKCATLLLKPDVVIPRIGERVASDTDETLQV